MPIGDTVTFVAFVPHRAGTVSPQSISSDWQTIIDAGGPAVQDAASITSPDTQITASTRHIFNRAGVGTNLLLRLAYDDGLTSITSPVVKVFGRTRGGQWMLLKTRGGNLTGTLTTAATDVTDGTLDYTTPDWDDTAWDCLGCDEILVGVETALAGTGTTSNAVIEGKFV